MRLKNTLEESSREWQRVDPHQYYVKVALKGVAPYGRANSLMSFSSDYPEGES